jgi:hypothetical protein
MDDGAMGAGFAGSFGCEYCADEDNRSFGHLDQLCDESGGVVVLRCPRCGSFLRVRRSRPGDGFV